MIPNAVQMADWREQAALASDALGAMSQAVVAVTGDGTVALCTDAARSYLAWYFNGGRDESDYLPQELRHWMTKQELQGTKNRHITTTCQPFTAQRGRRRLTVHLLSGRTTNYRLLLLEERRLEFSAEALQRHFGLSARRAEVLLWLAQGKTSDEIAAILRVSVSTIHKHTERVFEKLGVESRTAAALQAAEVMSRVY